MYCFCCVRRTEWSRVVAANRNAVSGTISCATFLGTFSKKGRCDCSCLVFLRRNQITASREVRIERQKFVEREARESKENLLHLPHEPSRASAHLLEDPVLCLHIFDLVHIGLGIDYEMGRVWLVLWQRTMGLRRPVDILSVILILCGEVK